MRLLPLAAILAGFLCIPAALLAQDHPVSSGALNTSGPAAIQLSLAQGSEDTFRVRLRNAGDRDLVLILGMMLGMGTKQYQDAITFALICPDGNRFQFAQSGPGLVTARIDPMIVALPKGATFEMPIDLNDYWIPFHPPKEKRPHPVFAPGRYTLRATLKGLSFADEFGKADTEPIASLTYWTGTVVSNDLQFMLDHEVRWGNK